MGKAARLKRARRETQNKQSQMSLFRVSMETNGEFTGIYCNDSIEGAMFEFAYENGQTYVGVIDPARLVKPRSAAEQENIRESVSLISKKLSSAVPEHIDYQVSMIQDIVRTLIWRDDMLRKYVREYKLYLDVVDDEETGEEYLEYNLAFSVAAAPKTYVTLWYDDALDACDRSATLGDLSEWVGELCPHCARNSGLVEMLTEEELASIGERALRLAEKLDCLVSEVIEQLPLSVLPKLVRSLGFVWETSPDGTWTEVSTRYEDEDSDEQDVEEDDVFHEINLWGAFTRYEYQANTRNGKTPVYHAEDVEYDENGRAVVEYGDGISEIIEKRDISKDIAKPSLTGGGKWALPKMYGDIEHGTVYLRDDLQRRIGSEIHMVLTDSVDQVEIVVTARGEQRIKDRSLIGKEDPTELERFAVRCEEMSRSGALDDIYRK